MYLFPKRRMVTCATSLVTAILVAGCGGNEVIQPTVSVSIGQQLIDLQKARDSGALNASDYERQKRQLIEGVK